MSTLISHKKQFIFIHINKAGGTSISSLLAEYEEWRPLKTIFRALERRYSSRKFKTFNCCGQTFVANHASAAMVRRALGSEKYSRYYKFAIVRNPWDREVSRYFFARKTPAHHLHALATQLDFGDFLRQRAERAIARQIGGYQFKKVSDNNGNLIVDTVVRIEHLENEIKPVFEAIGIDPDLQIPHLNRSNHNAYQKYYDNETVDLVSRFARDDIEHFDYRFE